MAVSVRYVARETASNLFRNRMMALAAILTVAVSLALVGTALLLRQAVSNQVGQWRNNVGLEIFVQPDVTPTEQAQITSMVHRTPQITSSQFLDHQQSYNLMKQLLVNDPTAIQAVTPAETPPVFQCVLAHPSDAQTVAALFQGQPGVFRVTWPEESIRAIQEVSTVLQTGFLAIALVLMISSLVLILNAIRMAIFSRRREVGVMKLVGATNWFIRIPFMLEGLVQGLLGALVAAGTVILVNDGFRYVVKHYDLKALQSAVVASHEIVVTEILIVLVGAVVGALGSALAVHRFLDV
jgi:cell division transport system permease protein